jgi:hypothetical protein
LGTTKTAKITKALGLPGFAIFVFFVTFVVQGWAAGKSDVADAAARGDITAVRALIAQKNDVNAPQADGATALHWAVFKSNRELVDILIKAGANPKAANREGSTPLWIASVNGDAATDRGVTHRRRRSQREASARTHAADDRVANGQRRGDEGAHRSRRRCERARNAAWALRR